MSIKGFVFTAIATVGVIVNYSSRILSKKLNISELAIKIAAFAAVLLSVTLLMIFGK